MPSPMSTPAGTFTGPPTTAIEAWRARSSLPSLRQEPSSKTAWRSTGEAKKPCGRTRILPTGGRAEWTARTEAAKKSVGRRKRLPHVGQTLSSVNTAIPASVGLGKGYDGRADRPLAHRNHGEQGRRFVALDAVAAHLIATQRENTDDRHVAGFLVEDESILVVGGDDDLARFAAHLNQGDEFTGFDIEHGDAIGIGIGHQKIGGRAVALGDRHDARSVPGEQGFPNFGAVGKDAHHGVHAVARDVQVSAVGGEAELPGGDGKRQAHHGLAGGHVVDGEAAIGRAAGDELAAVGAEAGDTGFGGSVDGAADRGLGEGDDGDGAIAARDDTGVIGSLAEIEIDGWGGQVDVTAGAHRIEGDFDQAGGVAIEHPERVAVAGDAHGDGGVTGTDAPRNGQQAGFDLVNGAIGGGEDVGRGGFGTGEHLGRSGVERDLPAGAETGEIDDADGASVPIGDEAVPEEALGFGPAAGRGGSAREQQGAPRNQGTVHSAILSPAGWIARRMLCCKKPARAQAGEMAEWLKAHAWKACLGETLTWVRIPLSPPVNYQHTSRVPLPAGSAPRFEDWAPR